MSSSESDDDGVSIVGSLSSDGAEGLDTLAPRRHDDPPILNDTEEVFYNASNLQDADREDWERRMLYRIFLRSPYPAPIWVEGAWHACQLGLVNEMSLFPRNALPEGVAFRCYAAALDTGSHLPLADVTVDCRAVPRAERPWAGTEDLAWPGFSGGRGSLDIRVTPGPGRALPVDFLLVIGPCRGEEEDRLHVMSLVVGPIALTADAGCRPTGEELLYFHRQLVLPPAHESDGNGNLPDALLIRESPEMAIPGKIWDSAVFAGPCALDLLLGDRASSVAAKRPHILDLSSGTGVCGFWLAAALERSGRRGLVTLTDLEEAVPVMTANLAIQRAARAAAAATTAKDATVPSGDREPVEVRVRTLAWGDADDLAALRRDAEPVDLVVACDLIYEAECLPALVQTLRALATPGRTRVVVGYKQRGLSAREKARLWETFERHFHVVRVGDVQGALDKPCLSAYVGVELWVLSVPEC